MGVVGFSSEGGVGIARIDNPPVNAINPAVVAGLSDALDAFDAAPDLVGLVVICAGSTFVAGGDLAAFEDPDFTPAPFNAVLDRIEGGTRPVAAALHGTVLGGGLELALACHLRAATPDCRLGLPEVMLGLVPGSLGTQRLPRLVGMDAAAELIRTGRPVDAARADVLGLVDVVVPDPRAAALDLVRQADPACLRRASRLPAPQSGDDALAALDAAAAKAPHLPALAGVARALRAARGDYADGERIERGVFMDLVASTPSRALRHVFRAERQARRIPDLPPGTRPREVARVGVLGIGTMGAGISMAFADAGYPVTMVETTPEHVERGEATITRAYDASVARGRIDRAEADARLARLSATTDLDVLSQVDLVVEAVFEDLDLKLDVARRLGEALRPGAILATNTSTLDVDRIAQASGRPGDVIGTHFFSPAQIMKLLEIVRGADTAPDVLATLMAVARDIRKTAVVSGVCYGFIGNRMAEVYMRENEALQLEGVPAARIDRVLEDPARLGLAMGPNRMLDMAGVDVGARTVVEWIKSGAGPQDPAYRILCRTMFEEGLHGRKAREGYYRYEGHEAHPSETTAAHAARLAAAHGVARRDDVLDDEIFERTIFPMVNEAAAILAEGIAYRGGDVDVVWTSGYGFPRWRGGPLFMADEIGLDRLVARLDHYGERHSAEDWRVTPLLRDLARASGRLSDWTSEGAS